MQFSPRKDDANFKEFVRNERVRKLSDGWFFSVREGGDRGPFVSKEEAELALKHYVRRQMMLQRIDEFN